MISDYRKGILMAAATAVLWGASGPFAKIISANGLNQITVTVYRTSFIVVALGLWLLRKRGGDAFRLPHNTLAAYGVMGFLSIVCTGMGYMLSCVYLTVPQAVILHYTFPLLTMLGDFVITKERPTLIQAGAGVLIVVGLYVGFAMGQGLGDISVVGAAWGVISVFGFAGQNLLTRSIMKGGKNDPLMQLFYANLFGGVMVILGKSAFLGWADLRLVTPRIMLLIQYPTIVAGLFGFALLFTSMKYIPATLASLLCSLEVVCTLAAMPLLLGTLPTLQETTGAMIILSAVAVSTIGTKRRPQQLPAGKRANG